MVGKDVVEAPKGIRAIGDILRTSTAMPSAGPFSSWKALPSAKLSSAKISSWGHVALRVANATGQSTVLCLLRSLACFGWLPLLDNVGNVNNVIGHPSESQRPALYHSKVEVGHSGMYVGEGKVAGSEVVDEALSILLVAVVVEFTPCIVIWCSSPIRTRVRIASRRFRCSSDGWGWFRV